MAQSVGGRAGSDGSVEDARQLPNLQPYSRPKSASKSMPKSDIDHAGTAVMGGVTSSRRWNPSEHYGPLSSGSLAEESVASTGGVEGLKANGSLPAVVVRSCDAFSIPGLGSTEGRAGKLLTDSSAFGGSREDLQASSGRGWHQGG